MGVLRFCILFGAFALVLAVLAVPALERKANGWGISGRTDPMSVASTGRGDGVYTIRRSVLQASPNSICITRANGTQSGDC